MTLRTKTADQDIQSRPALNGNAEVSSGNEVAPFSIDLCSGLGGLSLAAKQLGVKVLAGVDINQGALKTFARNFPNADSIEGSVRSNVVIKKCIELRQAQKQASPFIVLSGPPCQGFSVAGSRDPKDPRNKVLIGVAHAITKLQPDCALIENVSMVLAERYGDRLERLESILADGKYSVTQLLLNASEFGVPQKRKRAFFFITRRRLNREILIEKLQQHKINALGVKEVFRGLPKPPIRPDDYDDEIDYIGLPNHFAMQHSKRVMTKIAKILPGTGPMSYRKLHPEKPSNTLFSGHRAPPAHFREPRSITVREAARLQGFPDDFRIYGSFGNQMGQVTNAVPPPLARIALRVLLEAVGIRVEKS